MAAQSEPGIRSQRSFRPRRPDSVGSGLHGLVLIEIVTHLRREFPMCDSRNFYRSLMVLTMLCGSLSGFAGCNQKEKVIDIETPAGEIEVERTKDTGKIDINVDVDRK
jgi:hypothetical protein